MVLLTPCDEPLCINRRGAPRDVVLALQSSENTANTMVFVHVALLASRRNARFLLVQGIWCLHLSIPLVKNNTREKPKNTQKNNIWEAFCHLVKKPKKNSRKPKNKKQISGKSSARGRLQRVSENWVLFRVFLCFLEAFLVFCRFSWLPLLCVLRAPWLQSHLWMWKQLVRSAVLNSHSHQLA